MIHRIWAGNGDTVVIMTNPVASCADPVGDMATIATAFNVVDEGHLGSSIMPSRHPVTVLPKPIKNEREFQEFSHRGVL